MPRRFAPLLLLPLALLLFWNLGYAPFWNPDEGRYASSSYEMAYPIQGETSDWVVPHLNTMTRLNKPPLVYWMAAGGFRLFGPAEWAGRLPSALAAFGIALVLFQWGRIAFGTRAGLAGALVWCTSTFPFAMGRVLNTDMLLSFSITLASFGVWLAFRAREPESKEAKLYWQAVFIAGIGMGLALLSKGPVGVAIPLAIGFVYLLFTRDWPRAPWLAIPCALVIALIIGGPWFLAAQARFPDFLEIFLGKENVKRFSGGGNFHNGTTIFYYLPVLIGGLLPWTGFLFTTFASWALDERERRARLYLWIHAGFIVCLFSASQTKLISYILPAFPALALLIGAGVSRWESQASWRRISSIAVTLAIFAILVVVAAKYLLNEKIFPRAEGMIHVEQVTLVLICGAAGLLWCLRGQNPFRLLAVQGSIAALLFAALLRMGSAMAPHEDAAGLMQMVAGELKPGDKVVGYGAYEPNLVFYARRPVYFFGFKNTSGLREGELKASPYFPDYHQLADPNAPAPPPEPEKLIALLQSAPRVMVFSSQPVDVSVSGKSPLILWGRNNDDYLYATWPKPSGLNLELAAPNSRLIRRMQGLGK